MRKDTDLDHLFQLPLAEFTAARNALAKAAGKDGSAIKALTKPPLAAWAVNQLYWQDRDRYEGLIEAAAEMRRTHKAVIEDRRGDLRGAGHEHEAALDIALKSSLTILKQDGNPVTDATRQAILNTLRALPSAEAPGRLTRTLAPGGLEMLAGITPVASSKRTARPTEDGDDSPQSEPADLGKPTRTSTGREAAHARDERAAAERAIREADQRARHAEFETARAARETASMTRRVEAARKALNEARATLDEAQAELDAAQHEAERAERASEAAEGRSREAQRALELARSRHVP